MSERKRNSSKQSSRDENCECIDKCLESASSILIENNNGTIKSNAISVLNKSFIDCYLSCSECCKNIDYVSKFSEKMSKLLMNVYRCKSVKQLLDLTAKYVNDLSEGIRQAFPTVLIFKVKLFSRLTVHCSSKHLPLQISLAWDPIFNVPYIPSSTIKGVVRSYFEKNGISIDGIKPEELFGTAEHQGKLIFFDAYPVKCEGEYLVEADVITPHYKELDGLIDEVRSSPTPLVFPVIAKGTELVIIIALEEIPTKKSPPNTVHTLLIKNIISAFEEGLGAKTSVGYGRIKVVEYQGSESIEKKEQQK